MSLADLEGILESADWIRETVAFLIQQKEDPGSISIKGQLDIINDKVRQSVEAHFNKDMLEKVYKVREIAMTSSLQRTSFVTKLALATVPANAPASKIICCNLSMNSDGNLQIENIYHADGSPVEGFTKESE